MLENVYYNDRICILLHFIHLLCNFHSIMLALATLAILEIYNIVLMARLQCRSCGPVCVSLLTLRFSNLLVGCCYNCPILLCQGLQICIWNEYMQHCFKSLESNQQCDTSDHKDFLHRLCLREADQRNFNNIKDTYSEVKLSRPNIIAFIKFHHNL